MHTLNLHLAQVGEREVSLYLRGGVRREIHLARLCDLFHARCQPDGVSLRGVIHVQVIADLADDNLTGVQPDASREVQPATQAQLVGIAAQPVDKMQRRVAGAAGVILVRDRRAEQRHDPVAGELVDEALKALDPLRKNLEKAVHDLRPFFRVELLRQLHRSFHIGEQHRDLLALAFEHGARGQNLVGQMFGCVSAWRGCGGGGSGERGAALAAELGGRPVARAAAWTRGFQRRAALLTEG